MGRLLCASFVDGHGNLKTISITDLPGKTRIDDSRLAVAIRDELEKYDIIVGWNSKLHDIPLLNARLAKYGERPFRKDRMQIDLMYFARGQFVKIGSSKLDNVQKFFSSPNAKTPLDWETWQLAGTGDIAALARVVEHCEADVLVTRDVFAHLKPHVTTIHR